ncbi:MAG: 4Fe-4S dicluster-binding protein [Thermodesulfobacteriota bacterium]|nr:4Fe-4S dicluster-binding protein [Thermodesulfobacteriota bacterium]
MEKRKMGWKELPDAGSISAGTSSEFKTGDWRSQRPVFHKENCIHCLKCWVMCPDASIIVEDGKVVGYDYDHCKGCGICAYECPINKKVKFEKDKCAITMADEKEFQA